MWNSRDGGATWNDLTLGLTTIGMPGWGMVSKIEPSHHDAGTGNGFYYSLDDGAHWNQLQTNTVRLTAGGKTETQLLDVLRDRRRGRGRSEVSSGIANVDDPKSRQAKPTWTNRSLVRERGRGRTASRLRT